MEARARLLFGRRSAEARMEEELQFHLEMETERLVREDGLDTKEARRRAHVMFGGQDSYRESMREGRGMAWLSGLRLDLKLGVRMLVKYPVLTGASVLALAVAVALAVSWFEFMSNMAVPHLGWPDEDRIVRIQNLDLETAGVERRSLHDYELWRDQVRSITDLSAASTTTYTLTSDDGLIATLVGVRVTPAALRLFGARPLLGRSLTDADYEADAPPVVMIGFDAWHRVFGGDRSVLGRVVRLGTEHVSVVGVMPEGFEPPMNHELWTPLRESALGYERRSGPPLSVFGRLAPGSTIEAAQAELRVIGERTAAAFPETHGRLRPEVVRLKSANDMAGVAMLLNIPFLLFLIVVSANVATLLFARTATRESEIAMRIALGASRRRVILQLIAEALVITSLGALLGLAFAQAGFGRAMDLFWEVQQMRPPYFFDSELSAPGILYVVTLAMLGAAIIGAIPGLRATRRQLRDLIGQPGGSGMKFGAVATVVIVVQVALSVAFIPVAIMNAQELLPDRERTPFPAHTHLTGRLALQPGPGRQDRADGAELLAEVQRRLIAQPGVVAATRASRMPGFNHPTTTVEIDDDSIRIVRARALAIDPDFLDAMGARIIAGRAFSDTDVMADSRVAIVDEAWARETFGARNAVGRRIRFPAGTDNQQDGWYEIVGLVEGMSSAVGPGSYVPLFHPLRPEEHEAIQFYLRTEDQPAAHAPQVHALVAGVDPDLVISDIATLDDAWRPVQRADRFFAMALGLVGLIIVLFALMGVYALTSFSVAQRTREIGIRAALGANPRRILASIFSRALAQIGLGIIAGMLLVSLTVARSPEGLRLVAGVAAAMVIVGLIACTLPALRALRIQPTEALRAE